MGEMRSVLLSLLKALLRDYGKGFALHQSKYAKRRETMKRVTLVAVCLLFISAIAVAADAPQVEVFGGYSYLRCNIGDSDVSCNLNGWNASVVFNAPKYIGVVADFGGTYGTVDDVDTKIHSFLFGPKFAVRKDKVTPFAQALFGVAHSKKSVAGVSLSSDSDFAMALGGGLDINVGKKMAVRVAPEYLMTRREGETSNDFRLSAGIVLKLGNR
jgi:opacity protein-like surface antigen